VVHLAGQPFPAVQADVDVEGEPGLDAGVHEAEDRVDLVVVQMQALARPVAHLQLPALGVGDDLERHAGIDAAQDADQPLLDVVAGGDRAGDVLLAILPGVEIADLAPQVPRLVERGLVHLRADLLAVVAEVLQEHAPVPQEAPQPRRVGQAAQAAAQEDAVQAREHAPDNARELA